MATIKFISEYNCLLYIDTEFIDILEPNKLKIIELPIGSYLIEIKNNTNISIKSYILDVNEGITQMVQQIFTEKESIEDVLNNLKNDYTIRFYNQRLSFKHNNKYGYVNSRFEVVINPQYAQAEEFIRNKALVKKSFCNIDKVTIIDIDGNLCYERWFDYIGEDKDSLLLHYDNSYFTIDKNDYSILHEYKGRNYNQKDPYIPVSVKYGVDEMFGFIDTAGKEVIPFIYDDVKNYDDSGFAKVMRFGNERAIDRNGNLFFSYEEALKDGKESVRNTTYGILSLFGEFEEDEEEEYRVEEEKYIYHAQKLSCEESKNRDFGGNWSDNAYWEDEPIKEGKFWGLMEYDPFDDENTVQRIISHKCDRIIYYANGFFAYRVDGICKLLNIDNPNNIYSFEYDYILPVVSWQHTFQGQYDTIKLINVIVQRNGKYGILDLQGNQILPLEYDKIEVTQAFEYDISGKIGIIWKNRKCSLINLFTGQILDNLRFDEIIVNKHVTESFSADSTFIVRINDKYGCVDLHMKEIVPILYDSIDFSYNELGDGYHFTMMLYYANKVGTFEFRKYIPMNSYEKISDYKFSTNVEYDECVFLENNNSVASYGRLSFIGVRKGGKWGILDATPAWATYYPINNFEWNPHPNLEDLDFKYDSLEALLNDADEEFKRRYNKYNKPHMIIDMGGGSYTISVVNNDL